mmetsp:Transcript_470/g.1350  ORF Transcript_470/g.1350 Transcript_470/m.1350 type:complete len:250 (+) Transcript_470:321-1070(+)
MMPSPTKTTPLMNCSTAPRMEGTRAASCTAWMGVKTPSSGSAASCKAPKATPAYSPHTNRRSATSLAARLPPSSLRCMRCGTRMEAHELSASSTTPPSCQSCVEMVCAAAASPLGSMASVADVTAKNVRLMATERSCTANPPVSSGRSASHFGGRTMLCTLTSPRRSRMVMYATHDKISAKAVASAAPARPIAWMKPAPKMKTGSSATLSTCDTSVTLSGVIVSMVPRKALKATVETSAGMNEMPRVIM